MTVLEIINEVQRRLRLPQSTAISDAHAQLLLSYLNEVQRDYMMESVVWDELKTYGNFNTTAGTNIYTISITGGGEIEIIRSLRIGTNTPLEKFDNDEEFREYKRVYTAQAQPLMWRVYSRSGGNIIIEVCPTPDAVYQVDAEVVKKPPKLSLATDTPLLDSDTVILGITMLARKEMGLDAQGDLASFQAKLGLQSENQGESNFGDVEAV